MKEYIRSGGDITVVVASDKDVKVQPVREAFQKVLGRATIYGIPTKVLIFLILFQVRTNLIEFISFLHNHF